MDFGIYMNVIYTTSELILNSPLIVDRIHILASTTEQNICSLDVANLQIPDGLHDSLHPVD